MSDDEFFHKIIIDSVHGDIGLSELETALINTPTFQRLRRLKQLGMASLVYPNASYSRFTHSLGALYIANRVLEVFVRKGHIKTEAVRKLRLAALLHDVGHYPYSHLMEYIDWHAPTLAFLAQKNAPQGRPANHKMTPYPSHEKVSRLVITERPDIRDTLKKNRVDPQEIAALVEGEHQTIPNLLHRSLDIDRMDYLMRDSLNTGVPYGTVDLNYIVNNLEWTKEDQIVLASKARFSAEHLLLARYFMFNTVYLHKTVFGFEETVRRALLLLLQDGDCPIYRSGSDIERIVQEDSHEFLDFHDGYLDSLIDNTAKKNDDTPLTHLCQAVYFRRPPKLIHEVVDLSKDKKLCEEYIVFREFLRERLDEVASQIGLDPLCLIWREPKDVAFEKLNPFTTISQAKNAQTEEIRELVHVKDSNGNVVNLVEDPRSIIHHLSQLTLKVIRLYAVGITPEQENTLKAQIAEKIKQT